MKKKNVWILVIGIVLLIVGASRLYNYLGEQAHENGLLDMEMADDAVDSQQEEVVQPQEDEEEPSSQEQQAEVVKLKAAKDITVTDLEGNEVSLSDFKGKPVVLNFWATWCSVCKNEMIDFEIIYNQYKDDVVFMLVSITDGYQETVQKASSFIEKRGYTFPVYYDTLREAYFAYNIMALPITCFIDAEGNLVKQVKGGVDRMVLENGIAQILPE